MLVVAILAAEGLVAFCASLVVGLGICLAWKIEAHPTAPVASAHTFRAVLGHVRKG